MYSPVIDLINWVIWCVLVCILIMFIIACFRLDGLVHYERAAQNIIRTTGYMPSENSISHYDDGQLIAIPKNTIIHEQPSNNEIHNLNNMNATEYNNVMKQQTIYRLNALDYKMGYMFTIVPSHKDHITYTEKINSNTHQPVMTTKNGHQVPVMIPHNHYVNISNPHKMYGFGERIPFDIQINIPFNGVKYNDTSKDSQGFAFKTIVPSETTSDLHNDMTN